MTEPQTPHAEHVEFDNMCEQVEDYEPLPGVIPDPSRAVVPADQPEHLETIDAEILAGLVTP